ncbi:MAG TPA: hypothetical protein PLY93_04655 [Turneriella sp.]|nr:hypothetical protein [Turneriella sp.]
MQNQKGVFEPVKDSGIILRDAPQLLTLSFPDAAQMEALAEDLKMGQASRMSRLPPVSFVRFDFENKTSTAWRLELTPVFFTDAQGRKYTAYTEEKYNAHFTSVAYEHYKYAKLYAAQILRRGQATPKDTLALRTYLPGVAVDVETQEAGFQVLPFTFIPAGVEELTLYYLNPKNEAKSVKIGLKDKR